MKYFIIGLSSIICVFLTPALQAQEELTLFTTETSPYVVKLPNGSFKGLFYDRVACVLDKMQIDYAISLEPWKRAQAEVQAGRASGFFPASRSDLRDTYASISANIMYAEFYFYYLKTAPYQPDTPNFKEKATVSAFWGSMRYQELESGGYTIGPRAYTFESLFDLTDHGRVDAVLLPDVMAKAILKQRGTLNNYKRSFHSKRPMGVYFANAFLEKNPTFLMKFNQKISGCVPAY